LRTDRCFSGPGGNAKVSYPTTSEEATKVILSLLLTSPACVEFDDMDTDWIRTAPSKGCSRRRRSQTGF
jgi:hypothetical protein